MESMNNYNAAAYAYSDYDYRNLYPDGTPCENDPVRSKILQFVRMKASIQKLRIQCGNRICASFKTQIDAVKKNKNKLKNNETGAEEKDKEAADKEVDKLLKTLLSEYTRITDAYAESGGSIKRIIQTLSDAGELVNIKSLTDFDAIDEYKSLLAAEEKNRSALKRIVVEHPLYEAFFKKVVGCGPELAATLIARFDPYKARHAACFWSYAGLNPVTIIDKEGNEQIIGNGKRYTTMQPVYDQEGNKIGEKKGITYNPDLKTALLGVGATNFIKQGIRRDKESGIITAKGIYANMYMEYKHRKRNQYPERSLAHIDKMSKRWMMRNFVRDLWVAWRTLEGLPVTMPYEQQFLGRAPHKWPNHKVWMPYEDQPDQSCIED